MILAPQPTAEQVLARHRVTLRRVLPGWWTYRNYTIIHRPEWNDYRVTCEDGGMAGVEYLREARAAIAAHIISGGKAWHPRFVQL